MWANRSGHKTEMDWASLPTFGAAIALATASPGPTLGAPVAWVLGKSTAGARGFYAGLGLDDVVWFAPRSLPRCRRASRETAFRGNRVCGSGSSAVSCL